MPDPINDIVQPNRIVAQISRPAFSISAPVNQKIGAQGAKGDTGEKGEKGDTGDTGSTQFSGLTDKATADLPSINTPLANALNGKLSVALAATTYQTQAGMSGYVTDGELAAAISGIDLSAKANISGGNSFIGGQTITGTLAISGSQTWGTTKKFFLLPDWDGYGELSGGTLFGSYGNTGESFSFFAGINGPTAIGAKVAMGYASNGGTNVYSAVEVANVVTGYGTLKLMKSGGRVLVGTSTDNGVDALQVNGSISGTNLSGTNTGDQDLGAYAPINNPVFTGVVTGSTFTSTGSLTLQPFTNQDLVLATNRPIKLTNGSGLAIGNPAAGTSTNNFYLLSTSNNTNNIAFGLGSWSTQFYVGTNPLMSLSNSTVSVDGSFQAGATTIGAISVAGAASTNAVTMSPSWNTSGSPCVLFSRVTNLASGVNASLIDMGTGAGGSLFRVDLAGGASSLYERFGSGSPEGVVAAPVGAIYHRTDGGTDTALYKKETGTATSSGWVAVAAGGGSGLTHFTESVNTAAPNATVPVVQVIATNAAANVDAVLAPKGTGANLAQIPDNTSTGGNKRGTGATDWQKARAANTRVASGAYSTIGGGSQNTASAQNSTVAGGLNNSASANYATVAGGESNTASGQYSFAVGDTNTASGLNASAPGGLNNTASGTSSFATGQGTIASGAYSASFGSGGNSTAGFANAIVTGSGSLARIQGAFVQSNGTISGVMGSAQVERHVLRNFTNGATPVNLETTSAGGVQEITLPNNSTYSFIGQIAARSSTGDSAAWRFSGTIERGANAAATALVGTPTITDTNAEAGASTWAIAIVADTTGGALRFTVTGVAATNIRWVAQVETAEVVY